MTEPFSLDKCKDWINNEVISGKTSWEAFLKRMSDWQTAELAKHNYPAEGLAYVDQSIQNIQKAAEELGIFDKKPEQVAPKKTIYDAVKDK